MNPFTYSSIGGSNEFYKYQTSMNNNGHNKLHATLAWGFSAIAKSNMFNCVQNTNECVLERYVGVENDECFACV